MDIKCSAGADKSVLRSSCSVPHHCQECLMTDKRQLPPAGRSALKAGVVGNWVDNLHGCLPALALLPARPTLAGPGAHLGSGAMVVVAMLLGRPVGGL